MQDVQAEGGHAVGGAVRAQPPTLPTRVSPAHLRNRVRVRRHGRAEDVYHSERQADRAISASNEEDQFLVGSEHEILYFLFGLVEAGGEITREVRRVHGSRCALGAHVSREDLFQEDLSDEGAEDRELEKIARVVSVCRGVLRRR